MLVQVMMKVLSAGADDLRQRATDVILSAVQHDATPFRDFFTRQPETDQFQLLLRLVSSAATLVNRPFLSNPKLSIANDN